jgi:arginyl-tRNA synthetase
MLADIITKSIEKVVGSPVKFTVEHPENMNWGDYSTNVGIITHKAKEIAEKLKSEENLKKIISKIEIAKMGFINISIRKEALITQANQALDSKFKTQWSNKKIMLEFTDPNPFKLLHIGHLYTNIVGQSLSNILEIAGAHVKRVNYQGDVGMHVAKAIWGMVKNNWQKIKTRPLAEKIAFLGKCYSQGNQAYETDEAAKKEMTGLNKKIYALDPEINKVYQTGRQWSLDYFETVYRRLGTKFDWYFFEREAGEDGLKLVRQYLRKGVFKPSQGAIIFPGSQSGLHDRVFINKLDLPTYEAKDLGLALAKYQKYPYDLSIIITGNEVDEYFKVVFKALSKINPKLAAKTKHLGHGMVKLPEGKMSSRSGKVITVEWLLDEAKHRIQQNFKCSDAVGEQVGQAAVKYALLKSSIGNDVVFDFAKSISFEGNSGPYLQYTFARANSVLRKAGKSSRFKIPNLNPEEDLLLRTLYRFEEVVSEAADNLAPNKICEFLYDLAQKFNSFYNKHRVLGNNWRLWLTSATAEILKKGLSLLGITAPEKM